MGLELELEMELGVRVALLALYSGWSPVFGVMECGRRLKKIIYEAHNFPVIWLMSNIFTGNYKGYDY